MPTTLVGIAIYVFSLFPGLAFIFMREGHRPSVRRSIFRETATVVVVSVACNVVLSIAIVVASFWIEPLRTSISDALSLGSPYLILHFQAYAIATVVFLVAATALGGFLGSRTIHRAGLRRLWESGPVDRETSAWGIVFNAASDNEVTLIGIQLKSGGWIEGAMFAFDNSGDPEPHRTITLTGVVRFRPPGSHEIEVIQGYGSLVVEAEVIELLFVGIASIEDYKQLTTDVARPTPENNS